MKKKRLNKILGLFLTVSMVVQFNAGVVYPAEMYADSTVTQTTATSEVQNDDEAAVANEQDATTTSASSADAVITDSTAEQTSDTGDAAAADSAAKQDGNSEDASQASSGDTAAQSDDSASEETEDTAASEEIRFDRQNFPDGSYVDVTAPAGAFPEGIQLTVRQQSPADVLDEAKTASGNADLTEENIAAYDFDFYLGEKHDIEPEKDISVSFHDVALEGSDQAFSVYHVDDDNSVEKVSEQNLSEQAVSDRSVSFTMKEGRFSTYMVLRAAAAIEQGIWIGDDTATTYDTLAEAVSAASEGDIIHINGTFDSAAVSGAVVGSNITLDIAGNTTITGSNKVGFTLQDGARLQTQSGDVLTMTGFTNAITVKSGSVITDGTYVISDVNNGFVLDGTGKIEGTSRDNLNMTVTAKKNQVGFATTGRANAADAADYKTPNFVKATVIVNGGYQDGWTYRSVVTDDVTMELSDIWLYGYPLYVSNSDFTIKGRFNPNSWRGGHVLSVYETPASFVDSNVVVDGSRINVINEDGLTVDNSTLTIQNSPDGGMNINYGSSVYLEDSKLKGINNTKPLVAAGYNSQSNLYISGSSVVETDASSDGDVIGVNGEFAVTGGSYKTYFSTSYTSQQVPVNGSENGSEKLTLFQLNDPSVTELSILNANGETYTYDVARANEDGIKRVWVPKTTLTFRLMNTNAAFADGSTEDRSYAAIRGQSVLTYSKYYDNGQWVDNSYQDPGTPTDKNGAKFLGWFYKDASGTEHEFDAAAAVSDEMLVYARWEGNSVVYHNNGSDTVVENLPTGRTSATVKSFEEVKSGNAAFEIAGKKFTGWNTAADGSGTSYQAGDTLTLTDGGQIDLYAQYEDIEYSIRFSANGGTFSSDSVFCNTDYFTMETDANGGQVAVLNANATYGEKLHDVTDALNLDYNELKPDQNAKLTGFMLSDTENWYEDEQGNHAIRFDDHKKWGFWPVSGANPTISSDVIYYLKWTEDSNTPIYNDSEISTDINADMSAETPGTQNGEVSNAVLDVKDGDATTIYGKVDVSSIKNQIKAIADEFNKSEASYDSIALTKPQSSFTAVFTLPDEITVNQDELEVEAQGLGDCFELGSSTVSGKKITVTFTLKDGMTTFEKLYNAVQSTGIEGSLNGEDGNNLIVLKMNGFKFDTDKQDETVTVKGTVSGSFSAVATDNSSTASDLVMADSQNADSNTLRFEFKWNGVQAQSDDYMNPADEDELSVSYRLYKLLQLELPGDITTAGAMNSTSVQTVSPGEKLDYIGRLDISGIQDKINALADQFNVKTDEEEESISLQGLTSTFTAAVTFPEGLNIPDTLIPDENVLFTDNDLFEISSTEKADNVITVTFDLKNADSYTNFKQLKDAVNAVPRILEVTIKDVTAADDLRAGTACTAYGKLEGNFFSEARRNDTVKVFAFDWTGIQSTAANSADKTDEDGNVTSGLGDGRDDYLTDSDAPQTISYTVKTPDEMGLYGDILVDGNTQNHSVYQVVEGDTVDFTGALDVSPIQDYLPGLEDQFGTQGEGSSITLKKKDGNTGVDFSMTLSVTFPDGIEIPDAENFNAEVKDNSFGAFVIKDTEVDGQNVTVTFGLADDKISTYAQLKDAVDSAGTDGNGLMEILFPGLTVTGAGQYTVKVNYLKGNFYSAATKGERTIPFAFAWSTKQSCSDQQSALLGNGKDYMQDQNDNDTIAFTLKANAAEALDGDILINGDTEHDNVYSAAVGDELTYTATYDVSSIKDKMSTIEEQFGASEWTDDQYKQVSLKNVDSVFTTEIEVPDVLSDVWPVDRASYTLSGTDAFTITNVSKEGNKVIVTMTLNDGYDNYYKLREAIKNNDSTSEVLKLTVEPFAIPSTVKTNTNITVLGSVSGYMYADASHGDHVEHFAFRWNSVQDIDIPEGSNPNGGGDGTDKILEDAADKSQISATFQTVLQSVGADIPLVEKVIAGDDPAEDETFTFTLTADPESSSLPSNMEEDNMPMPSDADGSQMLTRTIEGEGTAEFGQLTFKEEGTYVYKVSEVKGKADGYTYDETVYTVTYVVNTSNGKLVSTRTIQKDDGRADSTLTKLTFTNKYQKPESVGEGNLKSSDASGVKSVSVKTGDDTPVALWIGLICIAGAVCMAFIGSYIRRNRKEKK